LLKKLGTSLTPLLLEEVELTDEDFLWPLGREGIWILGLENLTVAIEMSNDSHAKD